MTLHYVYAHVVRCQYDLDGKADEDMHDQQHKRKQDKLDHDQDRAQDELDREHDRRQDEVDQQHRRDMEKKRLELQAMDKRLKAMRLTMQWKLMEQDLEEERSLPYEKQDVAPSAPGLSE